MNKIKLWISGAVLGVISFLLMLLKIKSNKIESLKKEVKEEKAQNNVNKGSVEVLEKALDAQTKLDGTAESYNDLVGDFNSGKNK